MEERKLTGEEEAEVRKLLKSFRGGGFGFKGWAVIVLAIFIIIFPLLFLVVYFAEGKSAFEAARFGLFGVILFIVMAIVSVLTSARRRGGKYFEELERDLKEKIVVIREIEVVKAWRAFDTGYNKEGEEDLLFKTVEGKWICVPGEDIFGDDKKNPKSEIKLHLLKNSRHDIKVEFSGKRIPLAKKIIDVKNEWRNDDLSYNKVFSYERFSENLRRQIEE